MKKPLVAIVGRPNVGKSTFFNKIAGKRISIIDDMPGVTRDRIYANVEWSGYNFNLVDTGGLEYSSTDEFQKDIHRQAQIAIDLADVIIFMVDGKEGLTQSDKEVASVLRKTKKPIILVVNKLDNFDVSLTYEFYNLGLGEPMPVSSIQSKGFGEILDKIIENFNEKITEDKNTLKIAVVGRPNAGKSSIINRILQEDRVLVSDKAGTTRDAIDTDFKWNKLDCTIIDTAGIRKQKNIENNSVESYSVLRSYEAIDRSDIVLIILDANEEIGEQDVKIAGYVHEAGKPNLIVVNKWDLIKNEEGQKKFNKELANKLAFMDYFKVIFVSALTGHRFGDIMKNAYNSFENSSKRITTGVLNELLAKAVLANEPPYRSGKKVKINYITQAQTNPPTFVLFVNYPENLHFSYLRYIENFIRKHIDFSGTPIKLVLRGKGE